MNTGAGGASGSITDTYLYQVKDEISLQAGTHALKTGVSYNYLQDIGLLNGNEHAHVGYQHQIADNTSVSIDYTHLEGRHEFRTLNINPIVNGGARVLAADFQRVFGVANYLTNVNI